MYKSILVPIDLSDFNKGEACIEIARKIGGADCEIHLLNVVEEVPTYVAVELPEGLLQKNIDSARQKLSEMATAEGGHCDAQVRSGHAHRTILDTAYDTEAELVIVGSHRPGLQDYLLGSTAARVVRHATCSVLVIR